MSVGEDRLKFYGLMLVFIWMGFAMYSKEAGWFAVALCTAATIWDAVTTPR